jgi:hypothetical protein
MSGGSLIHGKLLSSGYKGSTEHVIVYVAVFKEPKYALFLHTFLFNHLHRFMKVLLD